MNETIELGSKAKRITINRDGQRVGELCFDQNDVLFAERFYALTQEFGSKQKEFESKMQDLEKRKEALDENGVPLVMGDEIILLHEVCEYFLRKVDTLFGQGTSKMLFGDTMNIEAIGEFFAHIIPFFQTSREKVTSKYSYTRSGKKVK